jgi:2-hydroxychromene-2-carboxylate isomerase
VNGSRFYFDLGSPLSYVVAERINGLFAEAEIGVPEWKPVLAAGLDCDAAAPEETKAAAERAASAAGLPPIRWPGSWPFDSTDAMVAATFAKQIGRTVAFSLAAFRQAFAGGQDLGSLDGILIAGAACELHPRALSGAIERESIREALANETEAARSGGIRQLPAIETGGRVIHGYDEIIATLTTAAANTVENQ